MASTPSYAGTPKVGMANLATANTARDGTGTIATVFSAGASGSMISRITVQATVTTTAGMVRLFLHDGTSYRLWRETPIAANTVSATVAGYSTAITPTPALFIPSGYSLRASTDKAESINVIAEGADL